MNEEERKNAWHILQDMSRKEQEEASKIYSKIKNLISEYGEEIPLDKALSYLGFRSLDEMIDWELSWLPRKELNIKMEYKEQKIKIKKDAFEEEDLGIYEFF